jgi:hypothetical protein
MEFCLLRDWELESWRGRVPRARSAVEEGATPDAILPAMPPTVLILAVVPAVMLRVEVLDEERWWRR